jgi:hypothetical protein
MSAMHRGPATAVVHTISELGLLLGQLGMVGAYAAAGGAYVAALSAEQLRDALSIQGELGLQLAKDAAAFAAGSTSEASLMGQDLAAGLTEDALAVANASGELFSATVRGFEFVFERCGLAIVARSANPELEVDDDLIEYIAEAQALARAQLEAVAKAEDKASKDHEEAMRTCREKVEEQTAKVRATASRLQALEAEIKQEQATLRRYQNEMDRAESEQEREIIKGMQAHAERIVTQLTEDFSTESQRKEELEAQELALRAALDTTAKEGAGLLERRTFAKDASLLKHERQTEQLRRDMQYVAELSKAELGTDVHVRHVKSGTSSKFVFEGGRA